MRNEQFFALVGPSGAGKSRLLAELKKVLSEDRYTFLRDSSGCGSEYAPHAKFTTRVTQLAKEGVHTCTTARSQLLLFWSRLETNIECVVKPNLDAGKIVIMDGFGGTILAHALYSAQDAAEEAALTDLHKSMIAHCVIGLGIKPPTYLLLKPSPEVAHERLAALERLPFDSSESLDFITAMNQGFDFYSRLPGQTVLPIDANRPFHEVLGIALSVISPKHLEANAIAA
jgi:thymidylate kinase